MSKSPYLHLRGVTGVTGYLGLLVKEAMEHGTGKKKEPGS